MKKYSIWSLSYSKRYYLTHPWYWFRDIWRNLKDAYRRATYGWTWVDCWNWDDWFLHTTPNMLRHIADYGSAYPGREPFTTPEAWHTWLHWIADMLETGQEEWQNAHNEYYDEYMNNLMNHKPISWVDTSGFTHTNVSNTEISHKYFDRANELAAQGDANVKKAMEELGAHFYNVWD